MTAHNTKSFTPPKMINEYVVDSIPNRFRQKRFRHFMALLQTLPKPLSILDVGGSEKYWESLGFYEPEVRITLLNLKARTIKDKNFISVVGDATSMPQFGDKSFDIVFSNSVIEHLFSWENQYKMANEISRIGKQYYIQTPNFFFPIEPHWWFPGFQFLPFSFRVFLTRNFTLGHQPKAESKTAAIKQVEEIRLLTIGEMKSLFPEAKIYSERFLGFTKSVTAYYFPNVSF